MLGRVGIYSSQKKVTLQRAARKFVVDHTERYDESSIPPAFTVSQITTIAWIAATKTLDEHKVSRELLASCYAAVQPSEAWVSEFARVFEKFQEENQGTVSDRANSMLFLNTARTTARDQSLNQPMVLRKLNFSEIFRQAAQAEEAAAQESKEEQERRHAESVMIQQQELDEAKRQAEVRVREEADRADIRARTEERESLAIATDQHLRIQADRFAGIVIRIVQIAIFIAFALSLFSDLFDLSAEPGWRRWAFAATLTLGVLTALSFLDAIDVKLVRRLLGRFRGWLSVRLCQLLKANFGALSIDEKSHDRQSEGAEAGPVVGRKARP